MTRTGGTLLAVHTVLVLVLVVLFVAAGAAHRGPDANIGQGLAGLALLLCGLPWSVHYLVDPGAYDGAAPAVRVLAVLGPAALNVLLHALLQWRFGRP